MIEKLRHGMVMKTIELGRITHWIDSKLALYFFFFPFFFSFFFSNSTFAYIRGPYRVLEIKPSLSLTHPNRGAGANNSFSSSYFIGSLVWEASFPVAVLPQRVTPSSACLKGVLVIPNFDSLFSCISFSYMKNKQVKSQF